MTRSTFSTGKLPSSRSSPSSDKYDCHEAYHGRYTWCITQGRAKLGSKFNSLFTSKPSPPAPPMQLLPPATTCTIITHGDSNCRARVPLQAKCLGVERSKSQPLYHIAFVARGPWKGPTRSYALRVMAPRILPIHCVHAHTRCMCKDQAPLLIVHILQLHCEPIRRSP